MMVVKISSDFLSCKAEPWVCSKVLVWFWPLTLPGPDLFFCLPFYSPFLISVYVHFPIFPSVSLYVSFIWPHCRQFCEPPLFPLCSEEALQIAVKRREAKSKGEKERYKHLNAEFQRTARRDNKVFLSYQCKEIEENNRMGKTRDLFNKIRDTKGTFHANMGSIKDRNGMDLTEAEDINKRWQEYTEELYKKDLHDPDNHDGVIT